MCEILDRIENRGWDRGAMKARISMSALIQRMLEEHRIDDLKRASMDSAYLDELLKEYHLTVTFDPDED